MNKTSKLLLTDKQEKIRTQWRVTVLSISLIYSSLALILMLIEVRLGFVAAMYLTLILTNFAFVWYCAYRKPGTKLLSFMMVLQPINLLGLIMSSVIISLGKCGMLSAFFWMITISSVWFYIASWRLRGVNKAIRDSNFL